ncbi:MAG: hypothetical protein WAK93_05980 [Solirubrobacteraceae bacterium]
MSIYDVHAVCRAALKDEQFRATLTADPETALSVFDLDPGERDALLRGDVATLYAQGAHEYVLMSLGRAEVLGLTVPEYMKRITQAEPHYIY